MTTAVLPDAELVVVTYLRRTGSRVRDLVGARVYTTLPKNPTYPLLRVMRIGGGPVRQTPAHLDAPLFQLDAYGGSKADARRLMATALAELADIAAVTHTSAVVTGADIGTLRYLPETDQTPARERYVADAVIYIHP